MHDRGVFMDHGAWRMWDRMGRAARRVGGVARARVCVYVCVCSDGRTWQWTDRKAGTDETLLDTAGVECRFFWWW